MRPLSGKLLLNIESGMAEALKEGLLSPHCFKTAGEAEKALLTALLIYKAAKHPEDKEFLRAYIQECEALIAASAAAVKNNKTPHQ